MKARHSTGWSGLLFFLVPAIVACSPAARPAPTPSPTVRLTIGGSGSAYPPLTALTHEFSARYPGVQVVFESSSQTSSAVKAVDAGTYDIGAIARPLGEAEHRPGLKEIYFARDAIVIAVHRGAKVESLSTTQVQAIYRGTVRSWAELGGSESDIIVLDRAEGETAKIAMRQYVLGGDLPIAPDATLLSTERDMFDAVANVPDTIGYFSMSYITPGGKVRAVSLDGVAPSLETLSSGAYRMVRPIGIVIREDRAATFPLRDFVVFLASAEAHALLVKEGLVPEKKP